jgi:hypothetical protein
LLEATSTSLRVGLGRVQILVFGVESNIGKILGPLTESAGFVQVGTVDLCRAIVTPPEPMELNQIRGESAFGYQSLDPQEEQGTVRFNNHPDASPGRLGYDRGQGYLGTRVEVDFGLLQVDKLSRTCGP